MRQQKSKHAYTPRIGRNWGVSHELQDHDCRRRWPGTACLSPFAKRRRREDPIADAPCASGRRFGAGSIATGCLEPCGKRHRGAIALESKTRTERPLTDLVRPTAAEDFRGQAFATVRTERTHASKIACRGANGQARPHSLQSEVGLEACRS